MAPTGKTSCRRSLTIQDLLKAHAPIEFPRDGGPPICSRLLARAQQAKGPKYDRLVHRVITEARQPVQAAYIEARVGGPRWKRVKSLRRLLSKGLIERSGITSATTYRALVES